MAEFKLSRAQQIARELWGEKEETWEMQTADVYQKLARGVIEATLRLDASVRHVVTGKLWAALGSNYDRYVDEAPDYAADVAWMTLNGVAYHIGYEAHLADGQGETEDDQAVRLNELYQAYQAVVTPLAEDPSKQI